MPEIKRILCPVDLSEFSRHALRHALALARWYDATVTVLQVVTPPQPTIPAPGMPETIAVTAPIPLDDVSEAVRRFVGTEHGGDIDRLETAVVVGSPARDILAKAEHLHADLLVMGTHGRSGFDRLVLGSVTDKVLRSTDIPVLTVPPPVERAELVTYKTIVCAIDFSDASTRALEHALAIAKNTDPRFILLHVVEGVIDQHQLLEASHFSVPEYYRYLEDDARSRLTAALPDDARVWCKPEVQVTSGRAYREILRVAQEAKAELIVMGVHGNGVINRHLFGSTTQHVIREAHCPVLTLRD